MNDVYERKLRQGSYCYIMVLIVALKVYFMQREVKWGSLSWIVTLRRSHILGCDTNSKEI